MGIEEDLNAAAQHGRFNRPEIEASDLCGCYYCLAVFLPVEITWWVDHEQTATCPSCIIDSVIGSESGYPMTAEFLTRMRQRWFGVTAASGEESDLPG